MRLLTSLLIAGALCAPAAHAAAPAPNTADGDVVRCQEDQPCWNWRTMGNHQRGLVTTGGRRLVVGPARFDRVRGGRHIDWRLSGHMLGDAT